MLSVDLFRVNQRQWASLNQQWTKPVALVATVTKDFDLAISQEDGQGLPLFLFVWSTLFLILLPWLCVSGYNRAIFFSVTVFAHLYFQYSFPWHFPPSKNCSFTKHNSNLLLAHSTVQFKLGETCVHYLKKADYETEKQIQRMPPGMSSERTGHQKIFQRRHTIC